jgi:hypothetical protein
VLQTFVDNIDPSDWVFDTAASTVWNADFTGNRVRLKVDDLIKNPMFAKVDRDTLRGLSGSGMSDDERLFFENDDTTQPYKEVVTCYEIFDRTSGKLKIWPVQNPSMMFYDEPWDGYDTGPLHYIDFLDVPNHVVGLSPMSLLHNLVDASNRALSKTISQTDAAKNVFRITSGNRAEAEELMEARDGQGVWMDGGGIAEVVNIPGPDGKTMAMVPYLKDLYNWLGGNINELAGLGVSAPTATQGQLLSQAASGMVKFMQSRVQEAVRGVAEAIIHSELKDEVNTEVMPVELADGSSFWRKLTPEQRNSIDAVLLNIDIDVYSMRYRSPEDRLQGLVQWWTTIALPSFPIWQQQGGEYDLQAFNRIYAEYADLSEISEIALNSVQPGAEEYAGSESNVPLKQSPMTTRTNVRMDGGGRNEELGGDMAKSLLATEAA